MNVMTNEDSTHLTHPSNESGSAADLVEEEYRRLGKPISALGRAMLEARREIERVGIPLLNREELDREKAERRGGTY